MQANALHLSQSKVHGGAGNPLVSSDAIVVALACMLAFLLLNPFLALLLMSLVSIYRRVPTAAFVVSATVSFSLFFYFRDYGVEWYSTSTDDVPTYIYLYESNYYLSFLDLLTNFVRAPNGSELLWHLPWWAIMHGFEVSSQTFVFLHYFLLFFLLFVALVALSPRYAVPLALFYLLLTPVSLDALAHIWRQQLASSLFLLGLGLHLARRSPVGRWLVIISPLVHFSFVFFVVIYIACDVARRGGAFDRPLRFIVGLVVLLVGVAVLARGAVFFLDSIGLARVMAYFEGYETDIVRRYIVTAIYAIPMLAAVYLYKNDSANYVMVVLCFSVFSIALAMPGANTIYERLLMTVVPMWGLFWFRALRINFSPYWQAPIFMLVFASGVSRLNALAANGEGVGSFLAFGNAFDPLMGVVKMLTTL